MDSLICDFSGVYAQEGFDLSGALGIDLKDVEGTHCYCTAVEEIEARLPEKLPWLRWLDSGDYHYMTYILAKRETEPFHLVLLDHHPDNQEPAFGGEVLSCGSWVKAMKEEHPQLRDVLSIGPEGCPQDIPEGWLEKRRGERLYLSLDKDILDLAWARTDWTQGSHTLEQVTAILDRLLATGQVVALDICGELTEAKGATPEDLRINKETNITLYKLCQKWK